jgi:ATP-binding cassette, subfamily F, member 3
VISLTNITLQRGRENLLLDTSLVVFEGRRVALIGRNGCGKSSLFALLRGEITPEAGDLSIPADSRISHMAQEVGHSDRTAIEHVLDGHTELRRLQSEIAAAEAAEDNHKLSHLYEELETAGGYSAEYQAAELLHGLGFSNEEITQPVNSFSGGWRIRLNLAQALMMPSDIMLLDEPTNHLDMDTTYWLEQRLRRYQGTLILISHDRDFIDNVANEIVHIEQKQLNLYKGNYSAFERQRAERLALQQSNYAKQQREIKHIQSFITRFKAKASKAKQAQSRVKQLANMEMVASAQIDSPFHFRFLENAKVSNPLISLRGLNLGYGDTRVLSDVTFSLNPGDRLGLLGVNGAGKSTLIKALTGDLEPQGGEITRGEHCYIGYFAQHQLEALDVHASAMLHLQRINAKATEQQIRNFLGGFDFHGDKAVEPIAPFSGGEKARLALALIVWQKPNVLLLDEPTNHLDLDMRSALTMALQEFTGALIVVSHDRHLLRHSVDQYILADQGKVEEFDGTLDDYHNFISAKDANSAQSKAPAKSQSKSSAVEAKPSLNKKQLRQQSAEQRKAKSAITNRVKRLEQKIEQAGSALKEVEELLADTGLYESERKHELTDLIHRQAEIKGELDTLEENWLELTEQLEVS